MPRTRSEAPEDAARARLVTALVALEFGAQSLDLAQPDRRDPMTDFARQVAVYLLAQLTDMNLTRIGALFGRHRSTVAHSIRAVEDGRDDPGLDDTLDRLETWLADILVDPSDDGLGEAA
ncbi:MAG: helix-turn-helix domain-containing protein [Litorimonas sp.]